jgi:hypothetical protein
MIDHAGRPHHLISLSTNGWVSVPFGWILLETPFGDEAKRLELVERLNQISGASIPADAIARYPGFPLAALTSPDAMKQLLNALDWFVNEVIAS